MHVLNSMEITAKRDEILATLRTNREKHKGIVVEARAGYMDKAREALEKRLAELQSGKLVTLTFSLAPPQDHTRVYDTAIRMLELHTGAEITLDSEQVRHLIMDQWDWMRGFLGQNAAYSGTAAMRLAEVNGENEGD